VVRPRAVTAGLQFQWPVSCVLGAPTARLVLPHRRTPEPLAWRQATPASPRPPSTPASSLATPSEPPCSTPSPRPRRGLPHRLCQLHERRLARGSRSAPGGRRRTWLHDRLLVDSRLVRRRPHRLLMRSANWRDDAACLDADPDLFSRSARPEPHCSGLTGEMDLPRLPGANAVPRVGDGSGIGASTWGGAAGGERHALRSGGIRDRRRSADQAAEGGLMPTTDEVAQR
jgi:hypothetical protein